MNTRDSVMSDRQMAVFLVNWCKFRGCGLTFATLGELIQHIEEIHISTKDLSGHGCKANCSTWFHFCMRLNQTYHVYKRYCVHAQCV